MLVEVLKPLIQLPQTVIQSFDGILPVGFMSGPPKSPRTPKISIPYGQEGQRNSHQQNEKEVRGWERQPFVQPCPNVDSNVRPSEIEGHDLQQHLGHTLVNLLDTWECQGYSHLEKPGDRRSIE